MARKRLKPGKRRAEEIRTGVRDSKGRLIPPYQIRENCLVTLGFSSYQEYLDSDLWATIRRRVLQRDKYKCRRCGERATQVHHRRYDLDTMRGDCIDRLVSTCRDCHHLAEFLPNGKRRGLRNTNNLLSRRISSQKR